MATALERLERAQQGDQQPQPQQSPQPERREVPADVIETRQQDIFPGSAGPAPSNLEVGEAPDTSEVTSQFLRGIANSAATAVGGVGPIPGGPSAGEVVRRGGFPSTGQEIAEATGGTVATGEPETALGRGARFGGAALGMAPMLGGGAQMVRRSVETGGTVPQRLLRWVRNRAAEGGEAARRRPVRFGVEETAAGAGAGVGGYFVEEALPDSTAARVIGELVGGVAAQGPLVRAGFHAMDAAGRHIREPFSESGSQRRAAQSVQGVQTAAEQGRGTAGLDEPTTIDPETGQPVLTPPQRTDTPGSVALERSVREGDSTGSLERNEQLSRANRVLQERTRGMGAGGTAEDTAGTIQEGQGELLQSMNRRLRETADRIDQRIRELGSGADREAANRIAEEEAEQALKFANRQEGQLFRRVDDNLAVPSTNARDAMDEATADLGQDQLEDIPRRARLRLNPDSDNFIGDSTNVKEMRSLQSKLREEGRIARSEGKFNSARIANDIADAITDDLDSAADESGALREAVNFSRVVKQRFRRGAVGEILERRSTGEKKVRPGETLERTIGGGRPSSREAMDEIRGALDDPEISARTGTTSDEFNRAAGDFVRQRFIRESVQDGELNPGAAQGFLRENDELLTRMPEVRDELQSAVQEGNVQRVLQKRRQSTKTSDPNVSRATLFIKKGPQKAFTEITDDSPEVAAREAQNLLNRARKDPSGKAVSGLKGGYTDFLLRPSSQRDAAGEAFVDGNALRDRRQNPSVQAVEKRIFSDEERGRLDEITRDFVRLQRARESGRIQDLDEQDKAGFLRRSIVRIAGAGAGRQAAAASGTGGTVQIPGQVAEAFDRLANAGFQDPAGRLLRDAVQDEGLWRDLMQAEVTPDAQLPKNARDRLNAWVAGIASEETQPEVSVGQPEVVEESGQDQQPSGNPLERLQRARERAGERRE